MTFRSAIATIVGCILIGACLGGSLGFGLAKFAPGYYRTVFPTPSDPNFDPTEVGIGLGLTQGTGLGTVVGLVLVAVLVWREVRRDGRLEPTSQPGAVPRHASARWILKVTAALLSLGFCLSCGLIVGLVLGERGAYHRRYLEEHRLLAAAMANEPAFAGIQIDERSDGGAYLIGELPHQPDFERLQAVVIRAVGETRAKLAAHAVHVK